MKKARIRRILDYIPLIILVVCAINLVIVVATTDIHFQKVHFVGLILLLLTITFFFINHKLGIVLLGLTILVGLIGYASLTWAIFSTSFGIGGLTIRFRPEFLAWAIIHVLVSGRYYVGIATKEYWEDIFDKGRSEPLQIED